MLLETIYCVTSDEYAEFMTEDEFKLFALNHFQETLQYDFENTEIENYLEELLDEDYNLSLPNEVYEIIMTEACFDFEKKLILSLNDVIAFVNDKIKDN